MLSRRQLEVESAMDIRKTQALRDILKDKSLLKDKCYIDGKWLSAATNPSMSPIRSTSSVIGSVPKLGAAETKQAIEAAEKAQKDLGRKDRQGALRHPAQMVHPDDGEPGRPGPDHDGGAGQAARRNRAAKSPMARPSSNSSPKRPSASMAKPFLRPGRMAAWS